MAVLLLGAMSCSDATTSPPSLTVAVSVTHVAAPVLGATSDSLPTIACDANLTATATGSGTASWRDAKVLWYAGTSRSVPLDSTVASAADVQTAWGSAQIAAGHAQTSVWAVTAGAPFHVMFEYNYQVTGGDAKTATAEFDCGPKIYGTTAPPSIDTVLVQTGSGPVQPGDSITVHYTVTSPIGVWQSVVTLSGPCTVTRSFPELLQPKVARSVSLKLASGCVLGVPITITVAANDEGLQTSTRVVATPVVLVDVTPPFLSVMYGTTDPALSGGSIPAGYYFGGDSIAAYVSAGDNHAMGDVVWQVLPSGAGLDDSVVVGGELVNAPEFIHLNRGTSGPIQLRLFARDLAGNVSDTIATPANGLTIYPTLDRPTASVDVASETSDAIPDPRHGFAYLLQPNDQRIFVLSLSTMLVTHTIFLPADPTDFDITAGGDSLIVALPGSHALGVVDLQQPGLPLTLLSLAGLDTIANPLPETLRTLANGKVFTVLASGLLAEVDLASGAKRIRYDAGNNGYVVDALLGRSLDHEVVVLNGGPTYMQRYDASTDRFGAPQSGPFSQVTPVLDSTGQTVAFDLDIYDDSLRFLRHAKGPVTIPGSVPTVLSADGSVLYEVLWYGNIVRSRVSDGGVLDRTLNPITEVRGSDRISDDGTLLITTQGLNPGKYEVSTITVH